MPYFARFFNRERYSRVDPKESAKSRVESALRCSGRGTIKAKHSRFNGMGINQVR